MENNINFNLKILQNLTMLPVQKRLFEKEKILFKSRQRFYDTKLASNSKNYYQIIIK